MNFQALPQKHILISKSFNDGLALTQGDEIRAEGKAAKSPGKRNQLGKRKTRNPDTPKMDS